MMNSLIIKKIKKSHKYFSAYSCKLHEVLKSLDRFKLYPLMKEDFEKMVQLDPNFKYLKSGSCSERLPDDPKWFYFRAFCILLRCVQNLLSVAKCKKIYGKMRNRGVKPLRFRPASGAIIRRIFQSLEKSGLVIKHAKGRYASEEGKKFARFCIDKYQQNVGKL